MTNDETKQIVKEKYGKIALQTLPVKSNGCCGSMTAPGIEFSIMADDYTNIEGYNPDADLALGCGLPTEFTKMKIGDTVLDLGSGAGNDAFIARRKVGSEGKVIGIDFTNEMIDKAKKNNEKLGYENVDFRFGDIEQMPVESSSVDVVISNCVLNLVPDKEKAFAEIKRVLNNQGHFCVSDIVLEGQLPDKIRDVATLYAGCVAGAMQKEEYLKIIRDAGFSDIEIAKQKLIEIPDEIMLNYISHDDYQTWKSSGAKILSITVTAYK